MMAGAAGSTEAVREEGKRAGSLQGRPILQRGRGCLAFGSLEVRTL
jgi:hypothetical protein